ncbi:hypothetical protein [Eubacterium callanderi]|uniref:hypothetical protein n=1 Tax=Eubacterium callanderi TaxID=53442 RepID=UPI001FAC7056
MTEVKAEGVRRSILEELNKLIGYTMENRYSWMRMCLQCWSGSRRPWDGKFW